LFLRNSQRMGVFQIRRRAKWPNPNRRKWIPFKPALTAILGPQGIRVNAVAPGVIDTDMSNFTKTEAGREVVLGMQALKRIGKPEDVADVVAFLASDKARWITGASIPVDGGSKL
jgi:NAD(P)-dependent dehydrogenase (short-subunit alcohol dehydrogenase family)